MSSGKIHFEGKQGTCWLISPTRVITAAHCVGPKDSQAMVNLNGTSVQAVVLDRDDALDAAVLEIPAIANPPPPLPVCERPRYAPESRWSAFGFPGVLDAHVLGLTLGGEIRNFYAGRSVSGDALQLQCDEGGLPHLPQLDDHGDAVQVFSGMSGAAVRAGGAAGPVVGLWLQSPTALHGVAIFVSPMESVVGRFRASLLDVVIRPWDDRPFLDIRRLPDGMCRIAAHPSLEEIASTWNVGSRPLRIVCDFPTGDARALQTALLRLILHAPQIAALEFSNHPDWHTAAIQAAKSGMPIDNFTAAAVIDPLPWSALAAPVPPLAMTADCPTLAVARAIHASCNRWTLERLVSEIDRVLAEEHTQELIRFHIAADLRDPMRELWEDWRPMLAGDPAFLGHFLTLMLTEDGDFDVTKRALIAVGPRTLSICLVRLLAYTLAVNCCLPKPFQPSPTIPGNLGHADHAGHACGIEIYQKQRLHLTIGSHEWRTPIVLIPHLEQKSGVVRAAALPLSAQSGVPNAALSSAPPRTWLLTGAKELHDAMSASRAALTALLLQQGEEFYALQKSYLPQVPNE